MFAYKEENSVLIATVPLVLPENPKLCRAVQLNLITISESSEIRHKIRLVDNALRHIMESQRPCPSVSAAVEDGEALDVEILNDGEAAGGGDDDGVDDVTKELATLRERAKKLALDLARLSVLDDADNEEGGHVLESVEEDADDGECHHG